MMSDAVKHEADRRNKKGFHRVGAVRAAEQEDVRLRPAETIVRKRLFCFARFTGLFHAPMNYPHTFVLSQSTSFSHAVASHVPHTAHKVGLRNLARTCAPHSVPSPWIAGRRAGAILSQTEACSWGIAVQRRWEGLHACKFEKKIKLGKGSVKTKKRA